MRNLGLWLHLLINIIPTLLSGSSNFCMQILAAPLREEVDKPTVPENGWILVFLASGTLEAEGGAG